MNETAEERKARRAAKEAEIKAKLAAEANALNNGIFGGAVSSRERQRDGRQHPGLAVPQQQDFGTGAGAAAAAHAAGQAAWGAGGGALGGVGAGMGQQRGAAQAHWMPPDPGLFGGRGQQQQPPPRPRQQRGWEGGGGRSGEPDRTAPAAGGREESVACPACFRAFPLSTIQAHEASCPGRSKGQPTAGGDTPAPAPSARDPAPSEPTVAEGRMQGLSLGGRGGGDPRKAAAEAAERRMRGAAAAAAQGGEEEAARPALAAVALLEAPPAADGSAKGRACVICFEEPASPYYGEAAAGGGEQGIWCPSSAHFTCRECFEGHVTSQSQAAPGVLAARSGRVLCPLAAHGCTQQAYAHTELAKAVSEAAFGAYMRACELAVEQRVVSGEMAARGGAAGAGAAIGGGGESSGGGDLGLLRRHIVDQILTLSCPRCGQVFLDFDGCCALTCPRCHCPFCAYCQEACESDSAAHNHVSRCVWNARKEVFSKKERFEEAQRGRRIRSLTAFLSRLDGETRARVLDLCRGDLEGVGIGPGDLGV